MIVAAVLAACSAASNAIASVLQRQAARHQPRDRLLRPALILQLARQPTWWAGMGGVVLGALFQGVALFSGALAVVQPVLATELPFTMLVAAVVLRGPLGRRPVVGTLALTAGIVLLLVAADPSGGHARVPAVRWWLTLPAVAVAVAALAFGGWIARGAPAAALFGSATAVTFALTAALMKDATARLSAGAAVFFGSWQLYATCLAGGAALYLLQNAYQAGTLIASQPAITVGDALVSLALSVALFDEHIRMGAWLPADLAGVALIVAGALEVSRSPLVAATSVPDAP